MKSCTYRPPIQLFLSHSEGPELWDVVEDDKRHVLERLAGGLAAGQEEDSEQADQPAHAGDTGERCVLPPAVLNALVVAHPGEGDGGVEGHPPPGEQPVQDTV